MAQPRQRSISLFPMNNAPIGIFDSGLGGLTVARAIMDQLPGESVYYLGDTANTPYGPKPIAQVRALALNALDQLVESGVKMLVIACNTASAAVLHDARERYNVPVFEVIVPAVRRAVNATRSGRVGVIGTPTTVKSGAYPDAFAAAPQLQVFQQACPLFVELVEAGRTDGPEVLGVARDYLAPLRSAQIDTLVLGCTHYPLLTGVLAYVMGPEVTLVSSAEETAKDVFGVLVAEDAARTDPTPPRHHFMATGNTHRFNRLAQRFLGPEVPTWEDPETTLTRGFAPIREELP